MVKYHTGHLDATFAALADLTRRAIVERLARGPRTIGQLAEPFRISLPAISRHLAVLERAGLIVRRRQGRVRQCTLVRRPMREARAWIARHQVAGVLARPRRG